MSTVVKLILEAEAASAMDFMRAAMREEGLRAAMQAAARRADSRREPSVPIGAPIANNSPGRPEVRVVGRSPQPARPIRHSMKSRIVPEPDQIQSAPPRRSSPLEPPGF